MSVCTAFRPMSVRTRLAETTAGTACQGGLVLTFGQLEPVLPVVWVHAEVLERAGEEPDGLPVEQERAVAHPHPALPSSRQRSVVVVSLESAGSSGSRTRGRLGTRCLRAAGAGAAAGGANRPRAVRPRDLARVPEEVDHHAGAAREPSLDLHRPSTGRRRGCKRRSEQPGVVRRPALPRTPGREGGPRVALRRGAVGPAQLRAAVRPALGEQRRALVCHRGSNPSVGVRYQQRENAAR